jgi:hypothetical protein
MAAVGKAAQILDALLSRAAELETAGPQLPVAMPEHPGGFNPPADGWYIEASVYPNGNSWEGITNGKMAQGLMGLTLNCPKGVGLIKPNELAQQIADYFPKNLVMRSGSTNVKVNREVEPSAPLIGTDKVAVPVNIFWEA